MKKTYEIFVYWFLKNNLNELTVLGQGSTILGIVRNDLEKFKREDQDPWNDIKVHGWK